MKIEVVCDFFGTSGYAMHARSLCNALYKEGVELSVIANRPQDWLKQVSDEEYKMLSTNNENIDYRLMITVPFITPLYWNDNVPTIQYCVWEGDKIPESWLYLFLDKRIKYIISPSQHTKDAILNTYKDYNYLIEDKIHIVPHGIDQNVFKEIPNMKDTTGFTFFADKGWPNSTLDRGGLSFLVKAFAEEFNYNEKVRLILKINAAYGLSKEMLDKNIADLNLQNKTPATMTLITNNLNLRQLNELYNQADVFVVPSLAESFHIGTLQALACGLPTIATSFGGHSELINEANGWKLIEGKLIENRWDPLYEGISWFKPNLSEMKRTLRKVYELRNSDEFKNKKLEAIRSAQDYTWTNSAKKLLDVISNK